MLDQNFRIVLCFLLFYSNNVLSARIVQVRVPDDLMIDFYNALKTLPPRLRLHISEKEYPEEGNQKDDDFKCLNYGKNNKECDKKQAARMFYEPSLPMPRFAKKVQYGTYGNLFTRRMSRTATHAGYTSNPDICKIYNHNLLKLWNKLNNCDIIDTPDAPNKMALHNIALIVKAYLDHHESSNNKNGKELTGSDAKSNITEPGVTEILSKVKELLMNVIDEHTSEKIADLIIHIAAPDTGVKDHERCAKSNEENINTYVNTALQKYLDDSNCRRGTKIEIDIAVAKYNPIKNTLPDKNVLGEHIKMDTNDVKKFLRQWEDDKFGNCDTHAMEKFMEKLRLIIDKYLIGSQQCSEKN